MRNSPVVAMLVWLLTMLGWLLAWIVVAFMVLSGILIVALFAFVAWILVSDGNVFGAVLAIGCGIGVLAYYRGAVRDEFPNGFHDLLPIPRLRLRPPRRG